LRAKSLHHVVATFTGPVCAEDFARLPGVHDIRVDGATLRCSAPQSALDALLKQVCRHAVVDFECAEAELEETFLRYYATTVAPGEGAGDAA
jgi:ABC-2 type transport system ATP-binding protein